MGADGGLALWWRGDVEGGKKIHGTMVSAHEAVLSAWSHVVRTCKAMSSTRCENGTTVVSTRIRVKLYMHALENIAHHPTKNLHNKRSFDRPLMDKDELGSNLFRTENKLAN